MATAPPRRTKIVATIGPASASPEMLRELIANGMDAARLNLSHGTHDDHAERARLIRDAQEEAGRPIAIIGDLQGPKIRVGELDAPMTLERGTEVVVVSNGTTRNGELPVAPSVIGDVLLPAPRGSSTTGSSASASRRSSTGARAAASSSAGA